MKLKNTVKNLFGRVARRYTRNKQINTVKALLKDVIIKQAEYGQHLDNHLNRTYTALLNRLDDNDRQALLIEQQDWLVFRDTESLLISRESPAEAVSNLSLPGIYAARTRIVCARIDALMLCLKNRERHHHIDNARQ